MRRFVLTWKKLGLDKTLGKLVTYVGIPEDRDRSFR
jgi:hypothetical protein